MPITTIQPARLQLHRVKGWKMPANSVSVARPHTWGNPAVVRGPYPRVSEPFRVYCDSGKGMGRCIATASTKVDAHQAAVDFFLKWFDSNVAEPGTELYEFRMIYGWHGFQLASVCRNLLHSKNLFCYCDLDMPCHGNVILKRANPELILP
jgi:uncharacterized protein DUF4326